MPGDSDRPWAAFCAPGRKEIAERALRQQGVPFASVEESDILDGYKDVVMINPVLIDELKAGVIPGPVVPPPGGWPLIAVPPPALLQPRVTIVPLSCP